jgi:hypothetical protein
VSAEPTGDDRPWETDEERAKKAADARAVNRWGIGCLIAFVLVAGGCAALLSSGGDSSNREPKLGDASARLACEHFRNIADDAAAGILADTEVRKKLQEVHDDARLSSTPEIASGAEAMLAAVTTGTGDNLTAAVRRFGASCSAIGM